MERAHSNITAHTNAPARRGMLVESIRAGSWVAWRVVCTAFTATVSRLGCVEATIFFKFGHMCQDTAGVLPWSNGSLISLSSLFSLRLERLADNHPGEGGGAGALFLLCLSLGVATFAPLGVVFCRPCSPPAHTAENKDKKQWLKYSMYLTGVYGGH